MTFTDDDLKRLKEFADNYRPDGVALRCEVLQALIARLEAAEELNGAWEDLEEEEISYDDLMAFRNRWREAVGHDCI